MKLDIRFPIGALFTLLGLILTLYGALGDSAMYARSLGHNVNLTWGLVMLTFGLVVLLYARRGAAARNSAA